MFGHDEGNGFFLEFQYPQFPSPPHQLGYSCNATTRSLHNNFDTYYPLSPWDFQSEFTAVRKVFGTDDLQVVSSEQKDGRSNSPLASESSSTTESVSRASRYSPEERKERIERYRSKRNLRNFNKKIKV
ncbi:UNVERIFIED_CONTAM: hypothetical protein Sradi_0392100 [Sesamum radiatum]|uniref:Uncharacterized protein n=1 Tax=Sesamum radiatum TaxID=300843 RepID=A0AAW2W4L9_SESRA